MLRSKFIISLVAAYLLLYTTYSFSQAYRNSGFSKPMNLPFNLAGSFGEPRPDHFHSGIDIKTNGVEGEPVFAVGDGYISRIRVSPFGYGKAIYITHTNGFTSVYGHLSKFYDKIEMYIHAQHYQLKKSELDLYLDATIFPVKQNDTIAFSGNTGGSSAPHLHFEIRNTTTEHALNPLDFYPRDFYVDTIPPQINKVKIYQLNRNKYPTATSIYTLKNINKNRIDALIDIDFFGEFYISLEGFDKQNNSENKNGINKIEVYRNGDFIFKYDLTEIDFDKTRMCNAFVDYTEMMNDSGYFYNCYKLKYNTLPICAAINNGAIGHYLTFPNPLKDTTELYILCSDYNNNLTKIKLNIFYEPVISVEKKHWWPDQPHSSHGGTKVKCINAVKPDTIISTDFKIMFPANSFYADEYIETYAYIRRDTSLSKTSGIFTVMNWENEVPLQKSASIQFKFSIKKNRNKIVMVRQNHKGKETALKTTFDKKTFYADTKELGTFYLKYDTTKPTVTIADSNTAVRNTIYAILKDNLSGINTYNGYIDDHWVNFYYDAKNDVIQYNLDEHCSKGEHLLKIIVTDNVGNKNIVQQKFNY
jgi:hypothetical protein